LYYSFKLAESPLRSPTLEGLERFLAIKTPWRMRKMAKWKYKFLKDGRVVSRRSGLTDRELGLLLDLTDDLFNANHSSRIFIEIQAENCRNRW